MGKMESLRRHLRFFRQHRVVPGLAPGDLRIDPESPKPVLQAVGFGSDSYEEATLGELSDLEPLRKAHPYVWLHVVGLGDVEVLKAIRERFNLHPLALEDVVNQNQRPKFEDYETHLYVTLQALTAEGGLPCEQVNIFWGEDYVITFQDRPTGRWDAVRERLKRGRKRIRVQGVDYLAYALMDSVVDRYFPVVEQQLDTLTLLEEEILRSTSPGVAERIAAIKHDLLALRRAIFPLRDAFGSLLRVESDLVNEPTLPYVRDALDHAMQLIELVETARDLSTNLMNVHMSVISFRTNEIMRVLTIIATLFIPLTFLAGIYGMNFAPEKSPWNMPELHWRYGYPAALLIMALIAGSLLYYFRRKGWLGKPRSSE